MNVLSWSSHRFVRERCLCRRCFSWRKGVIRAYIKVKNTPWSFHQNVFPFSKSSFIYQVKIHDCWQSPACKPWRQNQSPGLTALPWSCLVKWAKGKSCFGPSPGLELVGDVLCFSWWVQLILTVVGGSCCVVVLTSLPYLSIWGWWHYLKRFSTFPNLIYNLQTALLELSNTLNSTDVLKTGQCGRK